MSVGSSTTVSTAERGACFRCYSHQRCEDFEGAIIITAVGIIVLMSINLVLALNHSPIPWQVALPVAVGLTAFVVGIVYLRSKLIPSQNEGHGCGISWQLGLWLVLSRVALMFIVPLGILTLITLQWPVFLCCITAVVMILAIEYAALGGIFGCT